MKSHLRLFYFICFVLLLGVEIVIGAFVHDRFIRPYVGDMLVVILIYAFLRILFPTGIKHLIWYVFCFAAAVEFLQYFNLALLLGVGQYRLARIILGSTFDFKDIGCYFFGCLIVCGVSLLQQKKIGGRCGRQ